MTGPFFRLMAASLSYTTQTLRQHGRSQQHIDEAAEGRAFAKQVHMTHTPQWQTLSITSNAKADLLESLDELQAAVGLHDVFS